MDIGTWPDFKAPGPWLNLVATLAGLYAGKELLQWGYSAWTNRVKQGKALPMPPERHLIMQHIPLLIRVMSIKGIVHFDFALDYIMKQWPELGDIFLMKMVGVDFVIVCNADAVREILITYNYRKSPTYKPFAAVIGKKGLPSIEDHDEWSKHRKAFNPGFTPQFLRDAGLPIMVQKAHELIGRLQAAAASGTVVKMHQETVLLTFDIICLLCLSKDYGFLSSPTTHPMWEAFAKIIKNLVWRENHPHLMWLEYLPWVWWGLRSDEYRYNQTLMPVIKERLAEAKSNPDQAMQRKDILGLAIKHGLQEEQQHGGKGQSLSADDLLDQIKAFLFAGHDTTSSTIAFAVYEISRNPDVQAKLLQEVDSVCGRSEPPTTAQLLQLKYMGAVIKETLRVWPPAATARIAPPGTTLNGFDVGGKILYLPQLHVHRDKRYWGEDAEVFRPERWLDEDYVANLHPCAYMPFSKGLRDCIGQNFANMEMKVVLAMLYQRFTFEYVHDEPETFGYHITAYPVNQVPVNVHPRN